MPVLEFSLSILFIALVLDWLFGEPDLLWSRLPHPIVLFGKAVSFMDQRLNLADDANEIKYRKGALAVALLIGFAAAAGFVMRYVFGQIGFWGIIPETFLVFVLLAQRSLHDHVLAVSVGLREGGIDGGRWAVGMIVGRDPSDLDASGVARASIESLAENYSDGVVAPAFWYAVFGLPGLLVYKMINTADSMIGYKNDRYLWFGRVAAQADDLANWLPARISGLIIVFASGLVLGVSGFVRSFSTMMRDSGLHQSPNAGWPEAAMAGGLGVALGGPRYYSFGTVSQSYLNASGERVLSPAHIEQALSVFMASCFVFWAAVLVLALVL